MVVESIDFREITERSRAHYGQKDNEFYAFASRIVTRW